MNVVYHGTQVWLNKNYEFIENAVMHQITAINVLFQPWKN